MERDWLLNRFTTSRAKTEKLTAPLSEEDCVLQAMEDVSPTKWHLAHTSWFYEQFLLLSHQACFKPFRPDYSFLFNSYYEGVGTRVERPKRGLLSRPPLEEILRYRKFVTAAVADLLSESGTEALSVIAPLVEVGIHHEEQHQELILTDIKYNLYCNPQRPAYCEDHAVLKTRILTHASPNPPSSIPSASTPCSSQWKTYDAGIRSIGWESDEFAFDNERPRHRVFLEPFRISTRTVTNGEFLEFIETRGYERAEFWLSDGWAAVQRNKWSLPLYWEEDAHSFSVFTLSGMQPLNPEDPVMHLSHYEADAYARFRGFRLPSEAEWEVASCELHDLGKIWEWTSSAYLPYPGFQPFKNELGEYNGKFMSNQMVLRGGSLATPKLSMRPTYRNFFPPESRWQFSGMRLAQ